MPTNVSASIWIEMTKMWLILWMVYTYNVKGVEEVEMWARNEFTLHCWPGSPVMSDAVDHTSNFKVAI